MSLAIVFEITDILSPVDKVFVAESFAFFALLKKYFKFFYEQYPSKFLQE
jgi:hypothetical protein